MWLILAQKRKWYGSGNYEFEISAKSDSDHANDPDTTSSVMGVIVYFELTPVVCRNAMQKKVPIFGYVTKTK